MHSPRTGLSLVPALAPLLLCSWWHFLPSFIPSLHASIFFQLPHQHFLLWCNHGMAMCCEIHNSNWEIKLHISSPPLWTLEGTLLVHTLPVHAEHPVPGKVRRDPVLKMGSALHGETTCRSTALGSASLPTDSESTAGLGLESDPPKDSYYPLGHKWVWSM